MAKSKPKAKSKSKAGTKAKPKTRAKVKRKAKVKAKVNSKAKSVAKEVTMTPAGYMLRSHVPEGPIATKWERHKLQGWRSEAED